jgi:Spy/CpxP family protein refolding chaperone
MNTKHFAGSALLGLFVAGALLASSVNAQDNAPGGARREGGPGGPGGPGGAAPGQPPAGMGGRGGGIMLDEKQRELLTEARKKSGDEVRALEEKLRVAQRDFVRATVAEKYDEKVVREKADAIAKLQADMAVLNAKAFSSVAPTLKAEQREQIETSPFGYMYVSGGGGRPTFGGAGFGGQRGAAPGDGNAPGGRGGDRRRGGAPGQ